MFFEPQDVADAIIQIRGDRTQVDVAERAGIGKSQWNRYEAGRQFPEPGTVGRILLGLECSEDDLLNAALRARVRRLGVQEGASPASAAVGSGASDFQRLATELHALRAQLTMLSTYFLGLNQKIEQVLGEQSSN